MPKHFYLSLVSAVSQDKQCSDLNFYLHVASKTVALELPSSCAPLVLLRWWQFDLPSQISCTLYKSQCTTLSLVTDSKEGLRNGRARRFSLYQMPLKPPRIPAMANTMMKTDSSIKKARRKICRQ